MIGMFCGGSLTDILGAKLGVKWGRRLPIAGSRVTAILAYVGCIGLSMLPAEHSLNTPWWLASTVLDRGVLDRL